MERIATTAVRLPSPCGGTLIAPARGATVLESLHARIPYEDAEGR